MTLDRATLRVLGDFCVAAAESMAYTMLRTAHSTFVKETEDFTCQLVTPEGLTFASSKSIGASWFVGLDYGPVLPMIEGGYEEGDICMTSDPYSGYVATHSPDTHLWKPVFYKGELVCFTACHLHNTDVGGAVPASLSRALTEVHQEGLRIPPTKIFSKGHFNRDMLRVMAINVRAPLQNWGDLNAQIATVNTGERKILDMIKRFGLETFKTAMSELLDYAEHQARQVIREIPDGDYFFADYADEDSVGGYPCRIALTLKVHGETLTMDFTGSDPQLGSALNMPTGGHERHALITVGLMLVLATLNPNILLNCGTARVARAILPKGSVMNAVPPAAVGMRSLTCVLAQGVVLSAFSKALPDRLAANPAGVPSLINVKTSDRQGNPYMASIGPVGGGAGGSATSDGAEGAGATHSFVRNTPVEINESELPIRILRYGIVGDTGGPGTWRGGSAMIMEFKVFAPGSIVTARNRDRSLFASAGICGGLPGANSLFRKNPGTNREENLLNSDVVACNPGDVISLQGSGGGGYGDPMNRSAELVVDDVQRGLLSIERAHLDYGVAINADGSIDKETTQRLRALPAPVAKDFFSYCANRRTFERVWTDERYAALTRFLADIPVSWRFFVKHRIFGATQSAVADPSLDVPDIELLFRGVLAEFPDLAERR